eukprot:m.58678 g.58678  ORF g.58678 m.58678 type:complete len:97 (-) comp11276_c0_seq14:270-560(-)
MECVVEHCVFGEADENQFHQHIINSSCNINQKDDKGNTLLHLAVLCNRPDLVRTLLSNGADCGVKGPTDWSAVDEAIAIGNESIGVLFCGWFFNVR